MKKIIIDNLDKHEKKLIYKACFDLFVNNEQSYKPTYYINGYEIDRRNFVIFKQAYYDEYANFSERRQYDQMMIRRRNNRYEKVQSRYKEAFEAYINKRDTEDFYARLANKSMVSIETAKRYPEFYYEKYATDEEKAIYEDIKELNVEQKKNIKELTIKEKLKYMFDVCVNSEFDSEKIEMLTEKYSISPKTIKNYLIKYCELYASQEEIEAYKYAKRMYEEKNRKSIDNKPIENKEPYVNIFNRILQIDNTREVIYYLLNQKMDVLYLKSSVEQFSNSFPERNIAKIKDALNHYEKYLEYKRISDIKEAKENKIKENIIKLEKKKQQLKIEKQKRIILKYIAIIKDYNNCNYKNYLNYCTKKNITKKQFETALKITKRFNKPVYDKYAEKVKLQNQKAYPDKTLEITSIVNSIKENNFELVNYYESTNMNFDEILSFSRKILKDEDIEILKNYIERNKPNPNFNIKDLTKNDFIIMDYGKQNEITEEKSKKIVSFLSDKNIPINDKTYLSALRILENKKQKKKVA